VTLEAETGLDGGVGAGGVTDRGGTLQTGKWNKRYTMSETLRGHAWLDRVNVYIRGGNETSSDSGKEPAPN